MSRPPRIGRRRHLPRRPRLEVLDSFPLPPRPSGAFLAVNIVATVDGEMFPTVVLMAPCPGSDPVPVRGVGIEADELRPLALALREADDALREGVPH